MKALAMVMVKALVETLAVEESVTLMMMLLKVPAVVGVPESTPVVAFNVRPPGKVELVVKLLPPEPPVAVIVKE